MRGKENKYLFSGGGTGGHLYPAIAIADELKRNDLDAEILFIGTKHKIEAKVVPQKGYEFKTIWISGFQRKFNVKNFSVPVKIIVSMAQSYKILKIFQPDVVIGTGGYVCAPVLYVAQKLGIKTIIHESNSYPGFVTRFLAEKMTKVFISFDETKKWLKTTKNVELTGNPTRNVLGSIKKQEGIKFFNLDENKKTLLVFGGSLGSASINSAVLNIISNLVKNKIQIIWQAGLNDFDKIKTDLANKNINISDGVWVDKFIDKMEYAYAAADLILCRAGATTVAEITRVGKPVIFVPYPFAVSDHQTINAKTLVDNGAALLIKDNELKDKAESVIMRLLEDNNLRTEMINKSMKLGKPDADKIIVEKILNLI